MSSVGYRQSNSPQKFQTNSFDGGKKRPFTVQSGKPAKNAKPNLRMKGLRSTSGKMIKGCVKDTSSKLAIGSIPSNFQTIINTVHNEKAFGTSEPRVMKLSTASDSAYYKVKEVSCARKPYEDDWDNGIFDNENVSTCAGSTNAFNSASYSSKGFGPLIAKEKRQCFFNRCNKTPGPGTYHVVLSAFDKYQQKTQQTSNKQSNNLHKLLKSKMKQPHCRTDFQQKLKDIICTVNKLQKAFCPGPNDNYYQQELPGPSTYNYQARKTGKKTTKGWQCSFKTKVGRDGYIQKQQSPGPGVYQLQNDSLRNPYIKLKKRSASTSPDKENYITKKSQQKCERIIDQLFNREVYSIKRGKKGLGPGPCTYNQQIPQMRPFYQKIKNTNCFIEGTIDRFGQFTGEKYVEKNILEEETDGPATLDPGQYEIGSTFDKAKKIRLIEGAVFMSESKRQLFQASDKKLGPNMQTVFEETGTEKKAFKFNINDLWH